MQKTKYFDQILFLVSIVFFFACKKNDDIKNAEKSVENATNKINAWLKAKTQNANSNEEKAIEDLRQHLDFSQLFFDDTKNKRDESFIVIPIKQGMQVNSPNKVHSDHLAILLDANGKIIKGNIIEYVPKANGPVTLPANTISKIFAYHDIAVEGEFAILSITGQFRYQLLFNKGKFNGTKEFKKYKSATGEKTTGCIDWYWVTTYYWEDGSTTETREYLFRTCDDGSCPPYYLCQNPDSGGGTTPEDEIQWFTTKNVEWEVDVNPIGSFYGILKSYEMLTGNPNKITNISHNTEACINAVGVSNPHYAVWHKTIVETGPVSGANAVKSVVKGYLTFKGGNPDPNDDRADQQVQDVKVWTPGSINW